MQRKHSIINILGLSIGLACSIIILVYIRYELSDDKHQENFDTIYRIATSQPGNTYMGTNIFGTTSGKLKQALVDNIPEIEYASKFTLRTSVLEYDNKKINESGFLYADPDTYINYFIRLYCS